MLLWCKTHAQLTLINYHVVWLYGHGKKLYGKKLYRGQWQTVLLNSANEWSSSYNFNEGTGSYIHIHGSKNVSSQLDNSKTITHILKYKMHDKYVCGSKLLMQAVDRKQGIDKMNVGLSYGTCTTSFTQRSPIFWQTIRSIKNNQGYPSNKN